jgi:hypothetical protein
MDETRCSTMWYHFRVLVETLLRTGNRIGANVRRGLPRVYNDTFPKYEVQSSCHTVRVKSDTNEMFARNGL